MKGTTRKSGIKKIAASALSTAVLAIARASSSTACMVLYYQPKTPQEIKTRLSKTKVE